MKNSPKTGALPCLASLLSLLSLLSLKSLVWELRP